MNMPSDPNSTPTAFLPVGPAETVQKTFKVEGGSVVVTTMVQFVPDPPAVPQPPAEPLVEEYDDDPDYYGDEEPFGSYYRPEPRG